MTAKKKFDWSKTADRWGTPEHLAWEAKRDPSGRRFREPEVISDAEFARLMRGFREGSKQVAR